MMFINNNRLIFRFFCTILFLLGIHSCVFANEKIPSAANVNFKTIDEVNTGIANQLEFLIDYNKRNNAENRSDQNWYIYIVGDDTFNTDILSGYVEDQLDLTDIGIGNTPIKIEDLNKKLVEVNEKLSKDSEKPLIYYGIANKKTAIPAPYFPFENFFDKSSATSKEILDYYDNILGLTKPETTEASDNTAKLLRQFYDNEINESIKKLLTKTLEKAGQNGAVALSKYYYAFIKEKKGNEESAASISWWSRKKYILSEAYFKDNPVDKEKLKAHKRYLASTSDNNNFRSINAWLNYLTDAEIPESEFLKGVLEELINNSACNNLSDVDGEIQKNKFITAVNSGDADKTVEAVKSLCSSVIKKSGYENIIQAIRNIAKNTISEEAEVAVLYLMYNIKDTDYEKFFRDLKDPKEDLLMTLLVQIDDNSVNPFDGENYTSFIGQLLYISYQNNAKFLKKERAYLLETLLLSLDKFDWAKGSTEKAIEKVITFNLSSDEEEFYNYLKKDSYKSLLRALNEFSKEIIFNEELYSVADELGTFFTELDKEEVYLELLDIVFYQKDISSTGIYFDPEGMLRLKGFVAAMFNTVPKTSTRLYDYFKDQEFDRLKKILVSIDDSKGFYGENVEGLYEKFFNGVLDILNKEGNSVFERIALAKWAIESDKELLNFKDVQENLILNILKKLDTTTNKQEVYKFLNDNEQEFFKKCTADGVLSSEGRMSEFIIDFVKLVNEVGDVKDRIDVLKYAIAKGDDSIFYNDTESLVSYVFSEIKDYSDADYIINELKGENGDYKLFAQVWSILKESGLFEWFNTDNRYATNFITQISGIMKIAYGDPEKDLSQTVKDLMEKNYLDAKVGKIPTIDIDKDRFFPMARSGALFDDVGNTANDYEYEANIVINENTVNVEVSLNIVDTNGKNKKVVNTKTLKPLDFVTVQFIADTKVTNQVEFKKGDVIAVPAMYLAWMDNMIDGEQNEVIARVTMDGVVIIAAAATVIPSGGTSVGIATKLLAGAEIVFATTDAIIAINEDELKEALGADFVEGVETANLAFGIATLPAAVPGLIKITNKAGKIIKSGANTGFKAAVEGLSSLKGYKFEIDGAKLLQSLKNLKANAPGEFKKQMDLARNLLAKQKIKLEGIPASGKQAAQKFYNQALEFTTAFYLNNVPELATVVNKLPTKFQKQIVNGLLVLKFNGKDLCKIDPEGFLKRIDLYGKADNYKPIPGLEEPIPVKIKVQGKVYDDIVVIKDYKGSPIFRPKYKEGVKRSGDLINELHIRSGNSPPYKNGTDVVDYTIKPNEKFYVVEYLKNQEVPGGFGSNKPISSIEELRQELAVLESWKDPTKNGGVVIREYEALQPIKTRSGDIGPQTDVDGSYYPGGGHQYEFLENWRATSPSSYMKMVKETKLTSKAVSKIDDIFSTIKNHPDFQGFKTLCVNNPRVSVRLVDNEWAKFTSEIKTKYVIRADRNLAKMEFEGQEFLIASGKKFNNQMVNSGKFLPKEFVDNVNNGQRVFTPSIATRHLDTESLGLEYFAKLKNAVKGGTYPKVTGKVKMTSDLCPCPSCSAIFQQFSDMFPNVDIEIKTTTKLHY